MRNYSKFTFQRKPKTFPESGKKNRFCPGISTPASSATSSQRNPGNLFAPPTVPAFAANQRDTILKLLREAGPRGVSKEDLIFEHRMTQAAARVFELEKMGYVIRHVARPGERLVIFVLESEPLPLFSTSEVQSVRP